MNDGDIFTYGCAGERYVDIYQEGVTFRRREDEPLMCNGCNQYMSEGTCEVQGNVIDSDWASIIGRCGGSPSMLEKARAVRNRRMNANFGLRLSDQNNYDLARDLTSFSPNGDLPWADLPDIPPVSNDFMTRARGTLRDRVSRNNDRPPEIYRQEYMGDASIYANPEPSMSYETIDCPRCREPFNFIPEPDRRFSRATCPRCDLHVAVKFIEGENSEPEEEQPISDETRGFELRHLSKKHKKIITEATDEDGNTTLTSRQLNNILADVFWSGFDYHGEQKEE